MMIIIPSLLIRRIGVIGSFRHLALSTGCKVLRRSNTNLLHRPHFAVIKQPFSFHHHRSFSTINNDNKNNENKTNEGITQKDQTIEIPTTPETHPQSSTLENTTQDTHLNSNNQDQINNHEKADPSNDTQNAQPTSTNDQTAQAPINTNNTETETKGEQQTHGNLTTTTATTNTDQTITTTTDSNNNNNDNNTDSNNTEQEGEGWFKSLPLYKKILYSSIFLSIASVIGILVHQSNLRNSFPYKLVVPLIQNDAEIQAAIGGEDIREPKWYQSTLWGYVGDGLGTIDATAKLNIPLVGENGRKIYVRSTFRKNGTALSQWMIEYLEVTIDNNEKRILFIDRRRSSVEQ